MARNKLTKNEKGEKISERLQTKTALKHIEEITLPLGARNSPVSLKESAIDRCPLSI